MSLHISKDQKTALVFGGSGLVGSYCVEQLLASSTYGKVIAFVRRRLPMESPKLQQEIVDFDRLSRYAHLIKGDDLFCCLGTTMAKAGSKAAFRKIDYDLPLQIAQIAQANGVHQYLLVSSMGADPEALFFYSQVKGEIEAAVSQQKFWAVHIFRPSLLLGDRTESRPAEKIAQQLGRGLNYLLGNARVLRKYQPIEGSTVARAMIKAAQGLESGVYIYSSDDIYEIAGAGDRQVRINK